MVKTFFLWSSLLAVQVIPTYAQRTVSMSYSELASCQLWDQAEVENAKKHLNDFAFMNICINNNMQCPTLEEDVVYDFRSLSDSEAHADYNSSCTDAGGIIFDLSYSCSRDTYKYELAGDPWCLGATCDVAAAKSLAMTFISDYAFTNFEGTECTSTEDLETVIIDITNEGTSNQMTGVRSNAEESGAFQVPYLGITTILSIMAVVGMLS